MTFTKFTAKKMVASLVSIGAVVAVAGSANGELSQQKNLEWGGLGVTGVQLQAASGQDQPTKYEKRETLIRDLVKKLEPVDWATLPAGSKLRDPSQYEDGAYEEAKKEALEAGRNAAQEKYKKIYRNTMYGKIEWVRTMQGQQARDEVDRQVRAVRDKEIIKEMRNMLKNKEKPAHVEVELQEQSELPNKKNSALNNDMNLKIRVKRKERRIKESNNCDNACSSDSQCVDACCWFPRTCSHLLKKENTTAFKWICLVVVVFLGVFYWVHRQTWAIVAIIIVLAFSVYHVCCSTPEARDTTKEGLRNARKAIANGATKARKAIANGAKEVYHTTAEEAPKVILLWRPESAFTVI